MLWFDLEIPLRLWDAMAGKSRILPWNREQGLDDGPRLVPEGDNTVEQIMVCI